VVETDSGCDLFLPDLLSNFLAVLFIFESAHFDGLVNNLVPIIVFDVLYAFIANHSGGVAILNILSSGLHDAIRREQNRPWE